jgi:hypothetical protein
VCGHLHPANRKPNPQQEHQSVKPCFAGQLPSYSFFCCEEPERPSVQTPVSLISVSSLDPGGPRKTHHYALSLLEGPKTGN